MAQLRRIANVDRRAMSGPGVFDKVPTESHPHRTPSARVSTVAQNAVGHAPGRVRD